jgi:plastocyanin
MHFTKPTVFGLIQSTAVLAANHQVIVGQNNGLTFTPTTLNAAAGDTVQFMFATQVTQMLVYHSTDTNFIRTTLLLLALPIQDAPQVANSTRDSFQHQVLPPPALLLPPQALLPARSLPKAANGLSVERITFSLNARTLYRALRSLSRTPSRLRSTVPKLSIAKLAWSWSSTQPSR